MESSRRHRGDAFSRPSHVSTASPAWSCDRPVCVRKSCHLTTRKRPLAHLLSPASLALPTGRLYPVAGGLAPGWPVVPAHTGLKGPKELARSAWETPHRVPVCGRLPGAAGEQEGGRGPRSSRVTEPAVGCGDPLRSSRPRALSAQKGPGNGGDLSPRGSECSGGTPMQVLR